MRSFLLLSLQFLDIETPSSAKPAASKPARGGESKRKGQPEKPKTSSAPAKKASGKQHMQP